MINCIENSDIRGNRVLTFDVPKILKWRDGHYRLPVKRHISQPHIPLWDMGSSDKGRSSQVLHGKITQCHAALESSIYELFPIDGD